MRGLIFWMGFQMAIGIWLLISPFVLGFRDFMGLPLSNMICGAVVFILGSGIFLYAWSFRKGRPSN